MRGLAYFSIVSAVLYALIGMGLGIFMAASQDHTMAPVHAHLNLLGWVSFAIYGVYYHVAPAAAVTRLAKIQVGVATLGVWTIVPGIALVYMGGTEALAAIGSLVVIAGMLIFAAVVVRNKAVTA